MRKVSVRDTSQRELVDLNEIVREIVLLFRSEATQYSILIRTELAADVPQIMGDRVALQQALMNLMLNSIYAMKNVDGMRELTIQSQRSGNDQVRISVIDTALGFHRNRQTRFLMRSLQPRLGSNQTIRTNVRIIAATHRDLPAAIEAGTFRSDLFYRINVFPLEVPPLRERKEDIQVLVQYFVQRYSNKGGKKHKAHQQKQFGTLAVLSLAWQYSRVAECDRTLRHLVRIRHVFNR